MIIYNAYAKINLGLWITNKLPNGYHELKTILCPIQWHDQLTFVPNTKVTMNIINSNLLPDENNLCIRAARLLQEYTTSHQGAHIQLTKNIPIGAGLGGGSSDAASTLLALNTLWELLLPLEKLLGIATELGADVSFFLNPKYVAVASGIGEKVCFSTQSFPHYIVVVYPNIFVETKQAYSQLQLSLPKQHPSDDVIQSICNGQSLHPIENDFEKSVFASFPLLGELKKDFIQQGAIASLLSGSGSSVFGIFKNEIQATACYEYYKKIYPTSLTEKNFVPKLQSNS